MDKIYQKIKREAEGDRGPLPFACSQSHRPSKRERDRGERIWEPVTLFGRIDSRLLAWLFKVIAYHRWTRVEISGQFSRNETFCFMSAASPLQPLTALQIPDSGSRNKTSLW
ncbi:hypothetical protein OWV82_025008 [Melia azedarach]|uniref:Uncharacterized protein n=1 Tax=Melia azedarach TaxID=155640 RepID=A0ACC1WS57_MELAZ|nr:hypothetical protein OWV82_025008 [Melia azedarach]